MKFKRYIAVFVSALLCGSLTYGSMQKSRVARQKPKGADADQEMANFDLALINYSNHMSTHKESSETNVLEKKAREKDIKATFDKFTIEKQEFALTIIEDSGFKPAIFGIGGKGQPALQKPSAGAMAAASSRPPRQNVARSAAAPALVPAPSAQPTAHKPAAARKSVVASAAAVDTVKTDILAQFIPDAGIRDALEKKGLASEFIKLIKENQDAGSDKDVIQALINMNLRDYKSTHDGSAAAGAPQVAQAQVKTTAEPKRPTRSAQPTAHKPAAARKSVVASAAAVDTVKTDILAQFIPDAGIRDALEKKGLASEFIKLIKENQDAGSDKDVIQALINMNLRDYKSTHDGSAAAGAPQVAQAQVKTTAEPKRPTRSAQPTAHKPAAARKSVVASAAAVDTVKTGILAQFIPDAGIRVVLRQRRLELEFIKLIKENQDAGFNKKVIQELININLIGYKLIHDGSAAPATATLEPTTMNLGVLKKQAESISDETLIELVKAEINKPLFNGLIHNEEDTIELFIEKRGKAQHQIREKLLRLNSLVAHFNRIVGIRQTDELKMLQDKLERKIIAVDQLLEIMKRRERIFLTSRP